MILDINEQLDLYTEKLEQYLRHTSIFLYSINFNNNIIYIDYIVCNLAIINAYIPFYIDEYKICLM